MRISRFLRSGRSHPVLGSSSTVILAWYFRLTSNRVFKVFAAPSRSLPRSDVHQSMAFESKVATVLSTLSCSAKRSEL